jgi:hypothetical protein
MPQAWKDRSKLSRFIKSSWQNLHMRCANGIYLKWKNHEKSKHYDSIYIKFNREVYKKWCIERKDIIENLKRPSLDRIDNTKDYEIDNIQIIELAENIRKDKTVFTETTGRCWGCKEILPISVFRNEKRRYNGKSSICIPCDRNRKNTGTKTERKKE